MKGTFWIPLFILCGAVLRADNSEILMNAAGRRFDGAAARPVMHTVEGEGKKENGVQATEIKPKKKTLKKPLPPWVRPIVATMEPKMGFGVGFLAVESPAMLVMQIPRIGKILGWPLYFILLPFAVLAGALGAVVGWFFS